MATARAPQEEHSMVCYAPSTGTLAVIGVGIYVLWHRAIGHLLGLFGTVLEIALILSVEVVSAVALVWLTRQIRRRRAAAGACTTCRFRCQQALTRRPHLLVNQVDRRIPAPAPPALTCHPTAPLLPARAAVLPAVLLAGLTATARRLRPALQLSRPAALTASARAAASPRATATPVAAAARAQLARGHGAARFMGPVPAPFSVRGPVHAPVSTLPPSATRISSPTPVPAAARASAPEPEAVDVDGCVLTPDGVDLAGSSLATQPR
jgi:hypothetical protein